MFAATSNSQDDKLSVSSKSVPSLQEKDKEEAPNPAKIKRPNTSELEWRLQEKFNAVFTVKGERYLFTKKSLHCLGQSNKF